MSEESGGDRSSAAEDRSASGDQPDRFAADSPDGRADDPAEERSQESSWGSADDAPAAPDDEEYEPSLSGVFGAESADAPPRPEIVPESIDLENALFVLVGVLFGLFVIYRAVVVFTA